MINRLRTNWLIYESDILYLGGTVDYTGKVVVKSFRSKVEEAYVTLKNSHVFVRMERFRDGTAVICDFLDDNGMVLRKNSSAVKDFLCIRDMLLDKDEVFMEFVFIRTAKQVITFIAQTLSLLCFLVSVFRIVKAPFLIVSATGLVLLFSCIQFLILGALYSYYRKKTCLNKDCGSV